MPSFVIPSTPAGDTISPEDTLTPLIHEVFEERAKLTPDAVAVQCDGQTWTYAEVNNRANQIAHRLREAGVESEVLVGISVNRSVHLITGILGIMKAGGAYVPLDPDYPQARLEFMVEDASIAVLLTERKLNEQLPAAASVCRVYIDDFSDSSPCENLHLPLKPDNLAYVIFTSGSTGRPKGAMVMHRNVVRMLQGAQRQFHFCETDAWTLFHSYAFDASVWEMWGALFFGGRLVIVPYLVSRSPETFYALLRDAKVTVTAQTPSAFKQLVAAESALEHPEPLALRYIFFGGEALYAHMLKAWFDRHGDTQPQLVNLYGITEAAVTTTFHPLCIAEMSAKSSIIGRPLPGLRVYVLDEERKPVATGVQGELYLAGPGVGRGYLNRPELTAARFLQDPEDPTALMYKSGDLARSLPNGEIEYLGRADQQVKIRGFRIELGEIEADIAAADGVRAVAVVARNEAADDTRLAAYIVPKPGATISPRDLRPNLGHKLPPYMIPAWFVTVDALPLNPNGKLDTKALPPPTGVAEPMEYIAPKTREEKEIAAIWSDLLGVAQVGATDNFFELGGHSLLAVQIISRIRAALAVDLPVSALFNEPTVEKLAQRVESARNSAAPQQTPASAVSGAIPRIPATAQPPLSFAQQYLWLVHQIDPQTAAYNIPLATKLTGVLDTTCLERTLNEILRRHDILRASFPEATPTQRIAPSLAIPLPITDLRGLSGEAAQARMHDLAAEDSLTPFDLTTGPLVRAHLLRLEDCQHVLLLNLHHIVADGLSTVVFFRELSAIYKAFSEGSPSPLRELPIQYPDYAAWQKTRLQGPLYESQLTYWRSQLQSAPALQMPLDHPRQNGIPTAGGRQTVVIPRQLKEDIESLGRSEGSTLYMTLLAAFNLLLFRRTGQDDICIGSPTGGRNHVDVEKLIGFFNNTLVLRTRLDGDPTFRDLLARVRKIALDAFANQEIPFAKLVEELNPERSGNQNPFFTLFFNLLNFGDEKVSLPKLELEPMQPGEADSIFDLTLYARERQESIELIAVYNANLFDDPQIAEMLRQMREVLSQIAANPDRKLSEFSLLTPEAINVLPNPKTPIPAKWEGCLHELFAAHAARESTHPAVVDACGMWTYGQLDAASNRLANTFGSKGIGLGDVVAVYGQRGIPFVCSLLGIMKCGAAFTILDPAYPRQYLIERLQVARPAAFLQLDGSERLNEALSQAIRAICVKGSYAFTDILHTANEPSDNASQPPTVKAGPDDIAYIAFTSGSTGAPKGIIGTHRPLSHFIKWHAAAFNLDEADRFAMLSGLSHDPVLRDIFTPLSIGATLFVPSPGDLYTPGWVTAWLQRMRISVIHITPAMAQLIADSSQCAGTPFPELRHVFFGGDRLTQRGLANLRSHAPSARIVNFYGTTETPQAMSYFEVDRMCTRDPVPVGHGIEGAQLLVLCANKQPAGIGELGEIYIRTPYLSRGYCGGQEQTAQRFLANPFTNDPDDRLYRTGDLGRYLPDAAVDFAGRADRQLKIRGFRVEPAEIERAIGAHSAVRNSLVLCRRDRGIDQLVAYVVISHQAVPELKAELRAQLAGQLPRHAIPEEFVFVDSIPMTPNGKVDVQSLPQPETARVQGQVDLPTSDLEQQLVILWEDLLERKPIGIHDNFFDLGGHSLLAVRLFVQIQKLTGVMLPLAVLFQAPTIAQLADVLRQDEWQRSWKALIPIKASGSKPPLFCLHPVGGNVLCYRDLANHLDAEQPLFGLQARGLDGNNATFETLEEMAANYINEIRTVAPHGPYLLGGLSNGGYVAYEMAQQLRAQGEEVALLALFDSYPLVGWQKHFLRRLAGHLRVFCQLPSESKLAYLRGKLGFLGKSPSRAADNSAAQPGQTAQAAANEANSNIEALIVSVREANRRMVCRYRVRPYAGKTVLFRATERYPYYSEFKHEPEKGWRQLVADLEVVPSSGDHEHILAEPNVGALSAELQARMDCAIEKAAPR